MQLRFRAAALAALLSVAVLGPRLSAAVKLHANPIRKVVNMLQMMEKKIEGEGQKAEELFENFMCYCKNGRASLEASIASAEDKIPQLESSIKEAAASHQQLSEDLKQHKKDRAEAQDAMATATALRKKESDAFLKGSVDAKSNINALGKAIGAVAKGKGGGFLQDDASLVLRRLSLSMDMASGDRDLLAGFLETGQSGKYAPQSGEILGILKQMKEDMEKDLAEMVASEEGGVANHESLMSAKQKEVAAASKAVEEKTGRVGELAVSLAALKNDLEDTKEGLAEDKKFVADMGTACETKKGEWDIYQKNQAAEMMALADTIKMLNDDDATDLFKKTLPSPGASAASFVQLSSSSSVKKGKRKAAAHVLRGAKKHNDSRLDLLEMALKGKKEGFSQVVRKVDDLVQLLKGEQVADNMKKAYCEHELDKTEDDVKVQDRGVSDRQTVIAEASDELATVKGEIDGLMKGIKELDAQVAEATATRKKEHSQYVENSASSNAAKDLLELAKNRLAKFYNPSLYKKPAPAALDQVDAPPGPAPEADLTPKKSDQEAGGVVAMLNLLSDDLQKQILEIDLEEKQSQKDYEEFEKDAGDKRKIDSETVAEKESAKAELEATLHKNKESLKNQKIELADTKKELAGLHADCDWFMRNFDLRKEARTNEIDALMKAKAVLSGADYS